MKKILDNITGTKKNRQREYQLRYPEKLKEIQDRYEHSEKGKATRRARYLRLKGETSAS